MIPTSPIQAKRITQRAQDAAKRIGEKPTSVVFNVPTPGNPKGVNIAAQTVRLEFDNRSAVISSTAGAAPRMNLIIYGIRGHPTLPDTNMKEGYRFSVGGDGYTVTDIILQLGEVQGIAVATG